MELKNIVINTMKKLFLYVFLVLMLFIKNASATCDNKPGDGVDYSNCQFADGRKFTLGSIGECKLN